AVLGWQCGAASGCYLAGTEIQGLIVLNYPDYNPQRWHGSLLAIALVLVALFINSVLARNLPHLEGILLILHVFGFVAIVVPLWALSPRSSAREVFTHFNDGGNWGSFFSATLIGILSPMVTLIGPDAAVHMAEEVRNASKTIPRIMLATMAFNGALGFVMLVTLCFCVGNLEEVLETKTGYPFIQIFYNATPQGATTMVSILAVCGQFAGVTAMATASRQLFSFARDKGVHPGWKIPLNAVYASGVFSVLLVSISFGSNIAFNQLTALSTIALISTYMLSVGSMTILRIQGRPLMKCHYSLGRYGLLINILSMLFLMLAFVLLCFPPARNPTLDGMNWSIVIYTGVLVLSWGYYLARARHKYLGPVKLVKRVE
ncbi:MAG: hypothetical protein Q9226_009246, partial [Calogaya cf. arnoldii]